MKISSHCTRYTVSPVPVNGCIHRIGISAMCNFFYLIGMVSYSFDGRVFFEDFNKGVYIGRIIPVSYTHLDVYKRQESEYRWNAVAAYAGTYDSGRH